MLVEELKVKVGVEEYRVRGVYIEVSTGKIQGRVVGVVGGYGVYGKGELEIGVSVLSYKVGGNWVEIRCMEDLKELKLEEFNGYVYLREVRLDWELGFMRIGLECREGLESLYEVYKGVGSISLFDVKVKSREGLEFLLQTELVLFVMGLVEISEGVSVRDVKAEQLVCMGGYGCKMSVEQLEELKFDLRVTEGEVAGEGVYYIYVSGRGCISLRRAASGRECWVQYKSAMDLLRLENEIVCDKSKSRTRQGELRVIRELYKLMLEECRE